MEWYWRKKEKKRQWDQETHPFPKTFLRNLKHSGSILGEIAVAKMEHELAKTVRKIICFDTCRASQKYLNKINDPKLLWFCIASLCDWSRKRRSLNQSDAKLQRITIWSHTFSRALGRLVGFTPSSDRLLNLFPLLLIPRCDNDTHSVINEVSSWTHLPTLTLTM